MKTDIEIAQAAELRPIQEIAATIGLGPEDIVPYGHHKAKIPLDTARSKGSSDGKLVLVTGISPTPAGEGKSTTSVGLADALTLRGRNPVLCLREPSLGPVFGIKGGAAGGWLFSQVIPMRRDSTCTSHGDFHADDVRQQLRCSRRRLDASTCCSPQPARASTRTQHHLAVARDGHERSRTAQHRDRTGRAAPNGVPRQDRVR